jgi:uncharacterized DUF497 family protein
MFSWDIRKAISNFQKHGVSFEEAATTFGDEDGLDWVDTEHSKTENRWKRLARSQAGTVLITVYTTRRLKGGKETTRIISSRRASQRERKAYSG